MRLRRMPTMLAVCNCEEQPHDIVRVSATETHHVCHGCGCTTTVLTADAQDDTPPLVQPGQGRTEDDMRCDAKALAVCLLLAALVLILALCGWHP